MSGYDYPSYGGYGYAGYGYPASYGYGYAPGYAAYGYGASGLAVKERQSLKEMAWSLLSRLCLSGPRRPGAPRLQDMSSEAPY